MNTDVRLDHRMISVDHDERLHIMLELTAPERGGAARPPLALALVVDRSGSMHGEKLAAARACVTWLAERVAGSDLLGLVSFDDQVAVHVPAEPAATGRVAHEVARLRAGSTTNLSGGWLKGLEVLDRVPGEATRRILLLTDGIANVGITEPEALVRLARAAAERGVTTTTIGFGEGFDEDLLTAMADAGRGAAHYAASPDDAAAVFAEEAGDLAALAAQNVAVEIRGADPSVAGLTVLGDWPSSVVGDAVRVELGDAYAGRRRRLVFSLDIAGLPALGPRRVAELVVYSTVVGESIAQHRLEIPVVVHVATPQEAAAAGIDMDVREEVEILAAAQARKEAIDAADRGDYVGAHHTLRTAAARLDQFAAGSGKAGELRAQIDDLLSSAESVTPDAWDASVRKELRFKEHRAKRGREGR